VEYITQDRLYPPSEREHLNLSRKLPLYLRSALILFTAFAVVSVLTWALVQNRTPPPLNPFASFADIFPGQPESAVEARGISRPLPTYNFYGVVSDKYYSFSPAEGIFSDVRVTISNGIISQTIFMLRDHSLTLGDLAEIFGTSEIHVYSYTVFFVLPNNFVIARAVAVGHRPSPFGDVWSVAFNPPSSLS
jgi:hypothetical protein